MRKFFQFYTTRINNLSLFILSFSFILIASFFKIQILDNQHIKNKVNKIAFKSKKIYGNRGRILDTNNKQLSITTNKYDFWVNTNKPFDKEKIIRIFSKTFNNSDSLYIKKLDRKSNYVKLEKNILFTHCKDLIENSDSIEGLKIEKNSKRFYPYNSLASQTIGYVDLSGKGKAGIEESLDMILSGDTTTVKFKKGAKGKFYKDFNTSWKNIDGNDVLLTLDIDIQNILQEELKNAVVSTAALSANGIIISPETGDILAMASIPDYNPNNYFKYKVQNYKNKVITDSYEPGSTLKIIPLIASLNQNQDIINQKYYCENGIYQLTGNNKLRDHEPHDTLSIKDIFVYSSNIGISKIVNSIDYKDIYNLCKKFGFGTITGLPFKYEAKGKLRDIYNWSNTSKTYISIGQEIGITNMQLSLAYCAIANGGFLLKPHIIKSINNSDGTVLYKRKISVIRKVFESDISDQMLNILKEVVDHGTAKNLHLNGYDIGGKTGTAQKYVKDKYSDNEFISSFASIYPTNNPKYVIVISIDSPSYGKHWSNESAVPATKNIINRLIIMDQKTPSSKKQIMLQNKNIAKNTRNTMQNISVFKKEESFIVPNLIGKSLRSALEDANLAGIELVPIGLGGKIVWQSLKPGSIINNKSQCKVKLSI